MSWILAELNYDTPDEFEVEISDDAADASIRRSDGEVLKDGRYDLRWSKERGTMKIDVKEGRWYLVNVL